MTRLTLGDRILEFAHMPWYDANEAVAYAQIVGYGIDIECCQYPDTCPVQDGISRGLYTDIPRLLEPWSAVFTKE